MVDREVSVGDYVLSGGEPAALVLVDAVARLVPGVIDAESSAGDSFAEGLLEYPQYTRPESFDGVSVPAVLLSGHHAEVERWRRSEALRSPCWQRPSAAILAAVAAASRSRSSCQSRIDKRLLRPR
jgi:tRNA (guanine37-N1)-methyltransferase